MAKIHFVMPSNYAVAKAAYDHLNEEASTLSLVLQKYPSGPMGLTPDAVKASPEFQADCIAYNRASAKLKAFAQPFLKKFKKEYRADIEAARAAKIARNLAKG